MLPALTAIGFGLVQLQPGTVEKSPMYDCSDELVPFSRLVPTSVWLLELLLLELSLLLLFMNELSSLPIAALMLAVCDGIKLTNISPMLATAAMIMTDHVILFPSLSICLSHPPKNVILLF